MIIETSATLPFLQISPKVWIKNGCLYAKTSKIYQVLNLFSYSRTVVIDKQNKYIDIIIRYLWVFFSKNRIPFSDIKYIDRKIREVAESIGLTADGIGAHDVSEVIYVQVFRKSTCDPVNLFRFVGDGARYTGLFGVFVGGDSPIDFIGKQNEKSKSYEKLVSEFTGAPLSGERRLFNIDPSEMKYFCANCSHKFKEVVSKCVYCGSNEIKHG